MTAAAMVGNAPGTHRCAVARCPQSIRNDLLMCIGHWSRVPRRLQAEVWRTWRKVRPGAAPVEEFSGLWEAYLAARRAAINAVSGAI